MRAEVIGKNLGVQEETSVLSLCLKGKTWKYRGEGNANIVIALPQSRLILRLHKWEKDKEITSQIEFEEEQRVWREVVFCRLVMVPLLGSAYIQPPRPARLDKDVLVQLEKALKPLRPSYRTHKGIKFGYVTIYPDYALLPSDLENTSENLICFNNCKILPLQSIENQNYNCLDDISPKMLKCLSSVQKRNGTKYFIDDEDNLDDDLFIENNQNVNEGLEIPTFVCNRKDLKSTYLNQNNCQYVSSSFNNSIYCNNKIRGPRRFSTGSDCNLFLPSTNHYVSSSSAPINSQFVFQTDDSKNPPVFCVEIKPKQGWIPLMDRYNPKCTFCLNQYLKLSKGLIESISQYCPLDLFSGNEIRMRNALKNLLATPQNNLKLFRNGVLVYSDDVKTNDLFSVLNEWFKTDYEDDINDVGNFIDKFCDVVLKALTTDLTEGEKLPKIEDIPTQECTSNDNCKIVRDIWPSSPVINSSTSLFDLSPSCDWTSQQLSPNSILDRILKIQQLEQSGADAIYNMYKTIYPDENDYDYVSKLCDHPEGVIKLDPVQQYLLATTAKDCSILIAFQRINQCDNNVNNNFDSIRKIHTMSDVDGNLYAWNVGISDLDPKPLSCIKKHRKRDADVISSYIEYFRNV